MDKIRFGIISCGMIADFHAMAILKDGRAELTAVSGHSNIERTKEFAKKYGIEKVYMDYRDLAADKNVDAVCVCSPSGLHGIHTIECLKNGKHVLCEKPLEIKSEIMSEMIKTAEDNNLMLGCVFPNRTRSGQLGYDVVKRLNQLGIDHIGVDIDDFDITNKEQTIRYIFNYKPDVVVHCAAYTAVDKAEDDKEKCYAINVEGTRNIAEACKMTDAKMVYISTDYVFDGEGEEPQLESKPTGPINYYGYSKEQGEIAVKDILEKYFIIRTSWVYGKNGNNFVKTMLKLAQIKNEISVVNDQIGAPTYTKDLAILICDMIQTTKYGTYHGVNEGYCSWYEFAVAIFQKAGIKIKVNRIKTSEYPTKAKRPLNSRLSKENLDKNGLRRLPEWENALSRYLKEIL
jgi:dTDP-4-dehydrorhamnose reductase